MASVNKITEMIAAIKTIYSYYAKDTDVNLLVRTWTELLKAYDDDMVNAAFYKCLQTCKMPPTPADVIEQIAAMHKALEPSDEDLWGVYMDALRKTCNQVAMFGYTYVDDTGLSQGQQARRRVDSIWDGLPEKIKSYLGTKGELIRSAQQWGADADYGHWEKPRFMKSMPVMEKRREYNGLMLDSVGKFLLNGG